MKESAQKNPIKSTIGFNRPYWFAMLALVVCILVSATQTIKQTQVRHQTYAKLFEMQQEYRKMYTEEQRLLIEQQTFSATPVVAKRAVNDLKMFYPDDKHRRVVAPPNFERSHIATPALPEN